MSEAAAEGGSGVIRELLAVFSFGVDAHELEKGENKLEEFGGKLKQFAAGVAGAFAIHEIYEFAEAQVQAMTSIERTATQLGVSTEKVQAFQYAARSMGLEAGSLLNLMGRLQVSAAGAANGAGSGSKAFTALGISTKDASGHAKSADALFTDVAEAISKQTDAQKQAAIATQLFGRQGRTLLPLLKKGKEGVAELVAKYRELGGGYTEDAIEKSKQFEEAQADLTQVNIGLKSTISSALLPILTKLTKWGTAAVKWVVDLTKHSHILQSVLIILGAAAAVFAVQMAIAAAPLLLVVGALALLALGVDELITTFQGGDSLIKRWLDGAFGEGYTDAKVKQIKAAWDSVTMAIGQAWEKAKQYQATIEKIVKWMPQVMYYRGAYSLAQKGAEALGITGTDKPKTPAQLESVMPAPSQMMSSSEGYGNMSVGDVNITVPPGSDGKQIASQFMETVDTIHKQKTREAMSTYQRGASP